MPRIPTNDWAWDDKVERVGLTKQLGSAGEPSPGEIAGVLIRHV